jgi:hypothetical protein
VELPADVKVDGEWVFKHNWDEKAATLEKGNFKLNVSGLFSSTKAFDHEGMLASAHKVKCESDAEALVKKSLTPLPKEVLTATTPFETPKGKTHRPMPGRCAAAASKRLKLESH